MDLVVSVEGGLGLLRVPGVPGVHLLLAEVGEDVAGLCVHSVLLLLLGDSTLTKFKFPKPWKDLPKL